MDIPHIRHTQWGEEFDLIPSFGRYGNGRLAFQLYGDEGPFGTISVNLPDQQLASDGELFIKDWSENEEIVHTLVREGWLVRTGRSGRSGFVMVPVMNLAGPLLEWYDKLTPEEVQ